MSTRSSPSVGLGHLAIGVIFATGLGTILVEFLFRPFFKSRSHPVRPGKPTTKTEVANNLTHLIGNTPLLRINCLSELTGVEILAKCEFLNPGGSIKDRIALQIISEAEKAGKITPYTTPRCRVFEGTSGSTGISLALVARALGYEAEIVLPDDTATEKSELIEKMGGTIVKVRPVSISNRSHYVNVARDRARSFNEEGGQGLFVDQFENPLNWLTHYQTTGPEIWEQTQGKIDYFIAGAGTGGTIAGVGKFLKSKNHSIGLVLADPPGSGLFNKVKNGVMFSKTEIEGKRRRHQMDTVVEGIGSNRLTGNLAQIIETIDDAITVSDEESINMSRLILKEEGIFIGSSSAVNLVASYKLAQNLKTRSSNDSEGRGEAKKGPPITLVTILCDSGQRHLSKFWNDQFLIQHGFLDSSSSSSSSP
ncbi:hypothetical protein MJO29_012195 [Puccinia striiformis f. sp. tritici]|uniref:cysteine synthase n=2 Tax=Puccinia striiformis f. sp. tritici TaxID=168172 RepID=A0A0L0UWK1_9BASI|nr:hypothetical protein Pst134EA_022881 [Puccinia striiformis f. sp. tritici]KAH9455415.1 hypothetical protein Pst134EA_022881 [Puccinia striiformis f. sp. tritici]KAI7945807.1 hypothetical protein MJO29_012195 [Puccinia striiformis f. sp. tritici]KNE91316.1 hypothetical protein PSTG_15246 [Puccinia striiformis f. sp. tritici PST-78]